MNTSGKNNSNNINISTYPFVHRINNILNIVHIIIGATIVTLSILIFLNLEENKVFFPIIFFMAAILKVFTGICTFKMNVDRETSKKLKGVFSIFIGLIIFALFVISAISIWHIRLH